MICVYVFNNQSDHYQNILQCDYVQLIQKHNNDIQCKCSNFARKAFLGRIMFMLYNIIGGSVFLSCFSSEHDLKLQDIH